MFVVWLSGFLAAAFAAGGGRSPCAYSDASGAPQPIDCPESAHYADALPAIPKGLVWRALGEHKYQAEALLRSRKGKFVRDDPGADPYSVAPIEIKANGQAAPEAVRAPAAPAAADEALESAQRYWNNGDVISAASAASASLHEHPNRLAFLIRAMAYNRMGYYKEAVADAGSGLALSPRDPDLLEAKAYALENVGHQKADRPPPLPGKTPPPVKAKDETTMTLAAAPVRAIPLVGERGGLQPGGPGTSIAVLFLVAAAAVLGIAGGFFLGGAGRSASPARAYTNVDLPGQAAAKAEPAPVIAANLPPAQGPVLKGRFELRQKVGVGGMGIVYDGFDRSLGRRVAIKQMRSELKDNPIERDGFLSEAKIISHLSHPYIVGFHDVVEENGEIYLVFDFVDGKPLSQILAERKRLSLRECQQVFSFVCEAIACAHKNHVLHRDLKPSNIMVDKAGYAKVMDFGIAREAKESLTRLTQGETVGTPAYMAPEQHMGRSARASDIYALGVCLYETMTGQLPFPGPDFLGQKERMKYPPPQFLAPELPKEAELLFAATLALDPKKRVADAAELAESLKSLKA